MASLQLSEWVILPRGLEGPDWLLSLLEFIHWRTHSGLLEFLRVLERIGPA